MPSSITQYRQLSTTSSEWIHRPPASETIPAQESYPLSAPEKTGSRQLFQATLLRIIRQVFGISFVGGPMHEFDDTGAKPATLFKFHISQRDDAGNW